MPERFEYGREQKKELDIVRDELTSIVRSSEGKDRERKLHTYVQRRIAELESRVQPVELKAIRKTQVYDGFLHPESVVYPTQDERIPGFRIDHPKPYEQLVARLAGDEKLAVAIQETIDGYFGKLKKEEKKAAQASREKYYAHRGRSTTKISLNELWDRKMAMCVERAALAQNLFSFLGHESAYIGGYVHFDHGDSVEEGFHAYNLIRKDEAASMLYDPNNPTASGPALYALGAEDAKRIRDGQPVVIRRGNDVLTYNAPGGERYRE